MSKKRLVFVFFGGTWSGGELAALDFWFCDVERWIRHTLVQTMNAQGSPGDPLHESCCLFLVRRGDEISQEAYIESALKQLKRVPDGEAVAVCYSAGTELVRRVVMHRPDLFCAGLFLGGMEAGGFRWPTFLRAFWHAWFPFLRGFVTGNVDVASARCIPTFFTNTTPTQGMLPSIREALLPEPMRAILACTPLRWMVGVSASKPVPFPVLALVGENDFFLAGATYPGDNTRIVNVRNGTHALPLQRDVLVPALEQHTTLFADMVR